MAVASLHRGPSAAWFGAAVLTLTGCAAAPAPLAALGAVPSSYRLSAALGDVDGDGVADLLVSRNGAFEVFDGRAGLPRTFASAARPLGRPLTPTCESACEPRLVDFDDDGDLDLLSLHGVDAPGLGGPASAVWCANDGAGGFGPPRPVRSARGAPLALRGEPSAVALVDWDGDGYRDLLVATPRIFVHAGSPEGFAAAPAALDLSSRSFVVADWDGDGACDVILQDADRLILRRRTTAGFAAPQLLQVIAEHDPPLRLSACDWDGDGRPELLMGVQVRDAAQPLEEGERADLRGRVAAARRVVGAIDRLLDELNRSKPPLGDPDAMSRRDQRRAELRSWAAAPRALVARLQGRLRDASLPTLRGALRVLRR